MDKKSAAKGNKYTFNVSHFLLYFNVLFASFSASMLLIWFLFLRNNPSEGKDKLFFLGSCIISITVLVFSSKFKNLAENSFTAFIAFTSLAVGVLIKEHKEMSKEHVMGFGLAVLIIGISLGFALPVIVRNINKPVIRIALVLFATFLIFIAVISFWQTKNSLIESQHSEYVVNELLAPKAGYSQFVDFIPQYTFILGYLFNLIPGTFNYGLTLQIVVITLTTTAFFSLFSAVYIGSKFLSLKKLNLLFSIAIVVPLTSVTAGWDRLSFVGPPTTLLSGPAIREFTGFVLGFSLVFYLRNIRSEKSNYFWHAYLGSIAAIVAMINLDFGLAACAALFLTLLISIFNNKQYFKYVVIFVLGFWTTLIIIFGLLGITNNSPLFSQFAWFIRQFGGGFGAVPISYPGPVMFALPTIFSLMVFFGMLSVKLGRNKDESINIFISKISFYFATWTFFCTPYYLNRSYHSGQMSTLYLSLSVAIVGLFALLVKQPKLRFLSKFFAVPLLIVGVSIGSVWISPNPKIELSRIQGGNPDGNLPRANIENLVSQSRELKSELRNIGSFGYFGEEGNIFQLATGIKSANIFNNPLDMIQSEESIILGCKTLENRNFDYLITTPTSLQMFAWKGRTLCNGLYVESFKIGETVIAKRNKINSP